MPDRINRVADLFRMRLAQRSGQGAEDADLTAYGQSIGIGPMAAPAMPGKPAGQGEPSVPAGDQLGAMAPPGGGKPATMTESMRMKAQPTAPGGGQKPGTGIPALDALAEMPRRRSRGLVHDRKLGRVLPMGES